MEIAVVTGTSTGIGFATSLRLARHGYRARTAWPVDMMPQTWHVEVVCLLTKSPSQ